MPQKYITNRSFIERETECSSRSCVGVPRFGYRKLLGYSQGYRHYPPWLQGGYRYSWLQELHGVGYKCATGIGLLQDGYNLATGGKKATGILQVVSWLQAVRILLWQLASFLLVDIFLDLDIDLARRNENTF